MANVPDGFSVHTRSSAVTRPWEPIYANTGKGTFRLGLVIADAHCNGRGFLHGGVIAVLADNAMGLTLGLARGGGQPSGIVTTALALDYFGSGQVGQWLEIVPRLVNSGKSSGIVDAAILADGSPIARANATFRVVGKSPEV